jgi:hypothetical protein
MPFQRFRFHVRNAPEYFLTFKTHGYAIFFSFVQFTYLEQFSCSRKRATKCFSWWTRLYHILRPRMLAQKFLDVHAPNTLHRVYGPLIYVTIVFDVRKPIFSRNWRNNNIITIKCTECFLLLHTWHSPTLSKSALVVNSKQVSFSYLQERQSGFTWPASDTWRNFIITLLSENITAPTASYKHKVAADDAYPRTWAFKRKAVLLAFAKVWCLSRRILNLSTKGTNRIIII